MIKGTHQLVQTEELKNFDKLKPNKIIDVRGAVCPHPLNLIRDSIISLKDREILQAICDHEPTAKENAPRFCTRRGYPLQVIEQNGVWQIFIRKIEKTQPRLRVINISKVFKTNHGKVTALDNVNLTIQEGEFVCI